MSWQNSACHLVPQTGHNLLIHLVAGHVARFPSSGRLTVRPLALPRGNGDLVYRVVIGQAVHGHGGVAGLVNSRDAQVPLELLPALLLRGPAMIFIMASFQILW